MRKFYKIIREAPSFRREMLSGLGFLDDSIEDIFTFKWDEENRYIYIQFNKDPSEEVMSHIDRKLKRMAQIESVDNTEELHEEFIKCLSHEGLRRHKHYFNRPTYTRVE
jgi:hypothetical protein